jgi:hypothetical protein
MQGSLKQSFCGHCEPASGEAICLQTVEGKTGCFVATKTSLLATTDFGAFSTGHKWWATGSEDKDYSNARWATSRYVVATVHAML